MKQVNLAKIAKAFTEGVVFCGIDGQIIHINDIGKRILAVHPCILTCNNFSVVSKAPEISFQKSVGRYIRCGQMMPIPKQTFDERLQHCHFEGMRFAVDESNNRYLLLIKFWDQSIRMDRFAALKKTRSHAQEAQNRYLQAIKQNEANLRLALNSTAESMWRLDVDYNMMESELVWQKILGFAAKPQRFALENFLKQVHPDDAPLLQRAFERSIEYDTPLDCQYRVLDKQQNLFWFYLRGRATQRNDAGRALIIYGLHSDITAARLLEQKLSDTDASMNSLLRSMVDGVFIAKEECFAFANDSMLSILGYSRSAFINLPFEKVVDPENLEVWQKRYRARIKGKTDIPSRYETRLMKADGTRIWVELIATRVDYQGQSCVMGIIHDITDHKARENLIWQQANYDSLTALANRQYFENQLQQKMISAQRFEASMALLLIDLDNFKDINDTQGHGCGDQILLQVAQRFDAFVTDKGFVGRFGGDEFVMVIDNEASMPDLELMLYQLLSVLKKPISIAGAQYSLTASIGISVFPKDGISPAVLISNADQAMYVSKRNGRDRFSFFTPEMYTAAHKKMVLINDLRAAVIEKQWLLFYQPIIDLQQHNVIKAEALIRWRHPEKGMVSPDLFIPVAEESNLILEIGEWVLDEAISVARWLREHVSSAFQIAINQSAKQFQQHDERTQELTDIIAAHEIDADMISIEITENTVFDGGETAMLKLEKLRKMGVEVALDDFGTGYSSLSYLKKLDIDILKIDRSFISQLAMESDDQVLVEAIILMAHKLGLKVVAEGIETLEQLNMLVRAGCDYGQGYLFAKPMPAHDLIGYISDFEWPLPKIITVDKKHAKK
ncbi:MAG: EAL domain-containing protein [Methylophaga sp.]|nr:EAL domain-containing protein [Methylophaga sp.]